MAISIKFTTYKGNGLKKLNSSVNKHLYYVKLVLKKKTSVSSVEKALT